MSRMGSRSSVLLFLLGVSFVLALSGFAAAETIYSEGFEDATPPNLPVGCSSERIIGETGTWGTATGTLHPSGQPPHGGNNLAYFNSYTATTGNKARLSLGVLNLGIYENVTFHVWVYHETGYELSPEDIQVQVSTNGGTSWEDVGDPILRNDGTIGWAEASMDLSGYEGEEEVLLGILGNSFYGNDVYIDDILVEGEARINKATTPSPDDGSLDVAVDPTLSWIHSGNVSFDVYLGTESNDLPLLAGGLSEMSYAVSDLENSTTYYWRVDVRSGDLERSGDLWSFTTEADVFENYDTWGSAGCNAGILNPLFLLLLAPLGLLLRKSR